MPSIGGRGAGGGRPQTESTQPERQLCRGESVIRQRRCVFPVKQHETTAQHAEEVVGAGGRAEEEQQPGRLQVAEGMRSRRTSWWRRRSRSCRCTKASVPRGAPSTTSPWRSGGRVQAPTQTSVAELGSGWSAARFGGSSPAAFQTRVLPWGHLVRPNKNCLSSLKPAIFFVDKTFLYKLILKIWLLKPTDPCRILPCTYAKPTYFGARGRN